MNDLNGSCFIGRSKRQPQSDFFPHLLQGIQVRSPLQMELLGVKEELSGRGCSCSSASLSFLWKNTSIPCLSHYLHVEIYFLLPRQIWRVPLAHSALVAHAYILGTIARGNLQNPCCSHLKLCEARRCWFTQRSLEPWHFPADSHGRWGVSSA